MRRFMKAARIILLLMLVILSGCKDLRTKRTLVEFSSAPVPFPETVLKIQGTSVSSVAFPKDTMRMVYFTPPASCFTCSVLHSYELCNLFDQQEGYMTILLMAPKPEDLTELIASIEDSNYDFPIYVTENLDWLETTTIPKDERFHSFLVDKEGYPIFVGDPVRSEAAGEKFEQILEQQKKK